MSSLKRTVLFIFLLFMVSCRGSSGPSPTGDPSAWTFLVYMDGDNNLSSAALANMEKMRIAGNSDYVNVIVQVDLDNDTTKRYRIYNHSFELISDLGELDMSSPKTLTDFLAWSKATWSADRTVLVLWDHGNGWDQGDGPSSPLDKSGYRRSMFIDNQNNSISNARLLSNHRIKKAIQDSGIKLDILGFDACFMGTIEALYEFKDLANILVSSQEDTALDGWDYFSVITNLAANPAMDVEDLARVMVASYKSYYDPNPEKRYTLSAIRTSLLGQIGVKASSLADGLVTLLTDTVTQLQTVELISKVRGTALDGGTVQNIDYFISAHSVYVDLADVAAQLNPGTEIAQLIANATIAEYHGAARPNAHGVSIVFFKFPWARDHNQFDSNYKNYDPVTQTGNSGDFINQFHWDEFLAAYYSAYSAADL